MPAMPTQTPDSRPSLRERMAALRNLPKRMLDKIIGKRLGLLPKG